MPAALLGAVFPDFDMLFFHFVDGGRIHHHRYWVHIPVFWLVVAAVTLPVLARFGHAATGLVFFAAVLLHLLLDSIGGGIMWLYPFNDTLYELVTVPATRSHWIWSFMLHWTFALEVMIWIGALLLWRRERAANG
jgi:hypothetical protein